MRKLLFIILVGVQVAVADPDPKQIVEKSIQNGLLGTLEAKKVKLTATMKNQEEKIKEYKMWRKRIGTTNNSKTMSRFFKPQKINGQGVLLIERGVNSEGNDIRLYLPTFKRVRRIERNMQSGSFMGTAFSYSDMVAPEVEDYKYTYQKKTECPGDKKVQCHVILSKPKNREIHERRGYAYQLNWIREDNFMDDRMEGFNEKKKKIKIIEFSQTVKVGDQKWLTQKIVAHDLPNARNAIFEIIDFEANRPIDEKVFTESFLKNL